MLLKLSVLAFTIVVGSAQSSGDSVTSLIEATKGYFTSDVSLRGGRRGGRRRSSSRRRSTRRTRTRTVRRRPAPRRVIAKRQVIRKPSKTIKKIVKKASKIMKAKKSTKKIKKKVSSIKFKFKVGGNSHQRVTQVGGTFDKFGRQEYSDANRWSWYQDSGMPKTLLQSHYSSLLRFVFASCDRDNSGSVSQSEFQNALMTGLPGGKPMTRTSANALFKKMLFNNAQSLTYDYLDRSITYQAKKRAILMFNSFADQSSRLSETSFLNLMYSQGCPEVCVKARKLWQDIQGQQTGYVYEPSFILWASNLLKVQEVVDYFNL